MTSVVIHDQKTKNEIEQEFNTREEAIHYVKKYVEENKLKITSIDETEIEVTDKNYFIYLIEDDNEIDEDDQKFINDYNDYYLDEL
jgi:hypothetical protein